LENISINAKRYLLLMERSKMGAAEHMIDELITKHIKANPDLSNEIMIEGEEIRRAN
jgi:hypothetical protein